MSNLSVQASNSDTDNNQISNINLIPLTFKVILIGDCNTGKTSIIKRYVNSIYSEKYISTIGVDFVVKQIKHENFDIKLQIWDTAGQEKYKRITTSYYRGAKGAFIVFDLTDSESFNSLKKWAEDFCTISNLSPKERIIIILGNKSDLKNNRCLNRSEIDKFISLNNFIYFETSAKYNIGVNEAFDYFTKEVIKKYKNNKSTTLTDLGKGNGFIINDKGKDNEDNQKKSCC